MKKYIIKTGLLLFATFLFFSCNDEFLERYPLDEISSETFWNTENDLMVYNNNLYWMAGDYMNTPILWGHGEGKWNGAVSRDVNVWMLDAMSDNVVNMRQSYSWLVDIRSGVHTVPSGQSWREGEQYKGYFGWNFVRACNIGLANYSKAQVGQDIIDKYTAETRLLRGWFYGDKVQKFGDVSWVEKELNIDSEELYHARTPREEVMEKVLDDLTFACEKLPSDWGDGNAPGRLNRWAALAVTSRICLFEGTWRKYHGGSNPDFWLQKAADAAKEIIENGPYSLYVTGDPAHDYNASFRVQSDELAGNKEVIYWKRYKYGVLVNNVKIAKHSVGVTKSMAEDYLCTDGLPISLSPLYQGDEFYENIFVNRDPRLRQTILHPADQAYYNYGRSVYTYPRVPGVVGGPNTPSGYHLVKMYSDVTFGYGWGRGETPAILLRLGEVMLNYAEAKAELGILTQADLDISINKLRDRVGMVHMDLTNIPVDPRYVNDGVSPLIVEIRRERRVELFFEGFRYDDLRRWKQGKKLEIPSMGMRWDAAAKAKYDPAGTATVKTTTVSGVEYIDVYQGTDWANPVFNDKHYLWPIQRTSIAQNPNLGQNPGWD